MSILLDSITAFVRIIFFFEIHVNASITNLGGISFHVMAENLEQLKDALAFSSYLLE